MQFPAYWIPRPPCSLDDACKRACDQWLAAAIAHGLDTPLCYTLPMPKWQLLCYLADDHQLALHSSGDGTIRRFEPRQPNDVSTFGNLAAHHGRTNAV